MDSIVETMRRIASVMPISSSRLIAQALAGLAIDIENGRILIVKKKESVGRVIHKGAEARLARAQLLLGLPQLGDVLQDAKLAQRPPRVVPGHIALAVDGSHGAVGAHHPIFHVVARTAGAQRGRSGLGYSRSVLGVNQFQPAPVPRRQSTGCTPKIRQTSSERDTASVVKSRSHQPTCAIRCASSNLALVSPSSSPRA